MLTVLAYFLLIAVFVSLFWGLFTTVTATCDHFVRGFIAFIGALFVTVPIALVMWVIMWAVHTVVNA